jgi:hypothetical protein
MATPAVPNAVFDARRRFMSPCALAWSPACCPPGGPPDGPVSGPVRRCCLLAAATQSGHVQLWRWRLPSLEAAAAGGGGGAAAAAEPDPAPECLGAARVHAGGATALSWAVVPAAAAALVAGGSGGCEGRAAGGDFFLPRRAEAGDLLVLATGGGAAVGRRALGRRAMGRRWVARTAPRGAEQPPPTAGAEPPFSPPALPTNRGAHPLP